MLLKIKNLVMTTIGMFLIVGTTKAFAAPLMLSTSCLLYTSPSPRDQRGSGMAGCG